MSEEEENKEEEERKKEGEGGGLGGRPGSGTVTCRHQRPVGGQRRVWLARTEEERGIGGE